jgi:hypothetical protein
MISFRQLDFVSPIEIDLLGHLGFRLPLVINFEGSWIVVGRAAASIEPFYPILKKNLSSDRTMCCITVFFYLKYKGTQPSHVLGNERNTCEQKCDEISFQVACWNHTHRVYL